MVALGYLQPAQLSRVLECQDGQPPEERASVGGLCVEMGFLSRERLDLILDRYGKRLRIGELLVNRGRISSMQLVEALDRQKRQGGRLGEVLLVMGLINEQVLAETLAEQYDLAYIPLSGLEPQYELARYVNVHYATRHGVVPVGRLGQRLTVAIADPTLQEIPRDLERSTGLKVHVVLSTPSEVAVFTRHLYAFANEAERRSAETMEVAPPSSWLLRKLVTRAVALQATEIHLEPGDPDGRIRIRVGGALQEMTEEGRLKGRIPTLVRASKTLAHLETAETKRSQEGSIAFQTDEGDFSRTLSLHVSTIPGPVGEEAIIHLLDPRRAVPSLDDVGLSERMRIRFESIIAHAKGVVLIAGPPGSGKRGTLRASLNVLRRSDSKIFCVEDPIVFVQPGVSQAQVDPVSGNTYASHLRRFIRQDPDAIFLDELPDRETTEMALGAGASGLLVVATVRANNATDVIARMVDAGVDANMIASSLVAVLGQRLIRRICPDCSAPYEPPSMVLNQWFRGIPPAGKAVRGTGCEKCNGSGFLGRVVAGELWVPSPEESIWISEKVEARILRERVLRRVRCLGQNALEQAMEGQTTFEEILKVVPHEDVVFTRLHGLELEKGMLSSVPV